MNNWRILHKQKDITVGMWKETSAVYFTLENLTPDKDEDIEISLSIKDLERIISEAKVYETEIAEE